MHDATSRYRRTYKPELKKWRKWCPGSDDPETCLFRSKAGTAIRPKTGMIACLFRLCRRCGRVASNTFRRGLATVAHAEHVPDASIQSQLRHADIDTTRKVYIQSIPDEQKAAIARLEERALGPVPKPTKQRGRGA